jgi:UPF0176 acylphosphatase like domain
MQRTNFLLYRSVPAFVPQRFLRLGRTKSSAAIRNKSTAMMSTISNRELAEQRLAVYRARNEEIQESIARTNERNYELKERLTRRPDGGPQTLADQDLYQVKVVVCDELRHDLKLSGREKRGRVFLEPTNDAVSTLQGLKRELHAFFRALRKDTYVLSAGYPEICDDGKVVNSKINGTRWSIENDSDVVSTFGKAKEMFEASECLTRPAIVILVERDPDAPLPPPPPAYLEHMPDPATSAHMTMLSFYSFPKGGIDRPVTFAETLRKLWKPFQGLGRIYVATEGMNAQMSVPTNVLDRFILCCNDLPHGVGRYIQDNGGVNVDPVPLTREEFAVAAAPAGGKPVPPFKNLYIRVRQQVVADGLDRGYDWEQAGRMDGLDTALISVESLNSSFLLNSVLFQFPFSQDTICRL